MADEKINWKQFKRLKFDSRKISRRAKKAETTTTRHARKFVTSKFESLRSARQHIILWLILVAVLICAVALQMFWYQDAYRTSAWKESGTYAEAIDGPITTLNPLYATTSAELSSSRLVFSSLLRYDSTGHLADDLATSVKTSEDGKEYTVTIRKDASWSDGATVGADDIIYTVNTMKSTEARAVMYSNWVDISVEKVNDNTVKFVLPSSYASFPHALTFSILPQHILKSVSPAALRQHTFNVSPIGSGPFTLKLLQEAPAAKHKIANFSANTNYYRGAPKLSRFEIHAFTSRDDMAHALKTGEVSAAVGLNRNVSDIGPNLVTADIPVNSGVYALLNATSPVLSNVQVRKALQVGTDTNKLREALGYEVPELYLPFMQNQLQGELPAKPVHSTSEAAKLLDEAGWVKKPGNQIREDKDGKPLQLRVVTVENSEYEKVLEQMAGQWRRLGFDVKTEIRDRKSADQNFVQTTLQTRDYDVLLYELVIGADADVYAYWHSSQTSASGYNLANYKSTAADDSLSSARAKNEPVLRNKKHYDFATQWLADAPAIGLYQSVMRYSYRPSVQPSLRMRTIPSEVDRYNDILYWSAHEESVYKTP